MIRLSELLGQDAIALGTAAKTGTVKGIALSGGKIVSVALSDFTVPAAAVRSFEGDVLTYDDTQHDPADEPVVTGDPRGSRVVDLHGDLLGTIVDLMISADGAIDGIVMSDGQTIPGMRLQAIGSYAAVLNVDLPPPTGSPVA